MLIGFSPVFEFQFSVTGTPDTFVVTQVSGDKHKIVAESQGGNHYIRSTNRQTGALQIAINLSGDLGGSHIKHQNFTSVNGVHKAVKGSRLTGLVKSFDHFHNSDA